MFVESEATIGNFYLEIGDGASPEAFERWCELRELSGIGEDKPLVDITTVCNGGSRMYIGGLKDGSEFTATGNFVPGNDAQNELKAIHDSGLTANFQVVFETGSPEFVMSFSAIVKAWTINPSIEDANSITFTGKVSGPIVWA